MPARAVVAILVMLGVPAAAVAATEGTAWLRAGAYEVQVRLELPNLAEVAATRSTSVCVETDERGAPRGLAVLSENNPLAHCPAENVRAEGALLTFDIVCPGGNAARATARFDLTADGFSGRITMKMGGKNMTMTETQSGRRIGDCPASPAR